MQLQEHSYDVAIHQPGDPRREPEPMSEQERRNVEDFYAHRALVLKRIQQELARQKAK